MIMPVALPPKKQTIINIYQQFDFISYNHVLREGNWVGHSLVHYQPYDSTEGIWLEDGPESFLNFAYNDMYAYLNENQ